MTRNNDTTEPEFDNETQPSAPGKVAIEDNLPLTPIDIESQKDMEAKRCHPLRGLHKWFAARPTPAARLAVLASAYPGEIDSDELLKLMQIGPKELDKNIAEYVEKKFDEYQTGGGSIDSHYGYPNPNRQNPSEKEIEKLHKKLYDGWGGELPTILDPTCGRGIIPFEAMRYGFPVVANELNPIPTLISKIALEYAPEVGSVKPEIYEWRDKIHKTAKENIEEYYPTEGENREILNSSFTYLIECDSCGGKIPLVGKWWVNKTTNGGDVIVPQYVNGEVVYSHFKSQDISKGVINDVENIDLNISEKLTENTFEEIVEGQNGLEPTKDMNIYIDESDVKNIEEIHSNTQFDSLRSDEEVQSFIKKKLVNGILDGYKPNDGPVSHADAECPHCGVVTDSDTVREKIRNGNFEYSIYSVNYQTSDGENHFRAGGQTDEKGMKLARERIESDFGMMDFLSEPIQSGEKTRELHNYGMEQWQEIFTPRQIITHYELLQAYNEHKQDIIDTYSRKKAELILTILTFGASRVLQNQNRMVPWYDKGGYGDDMFQDNNFALKKMAGDNNVVAPRKGYIHASDRIIDKYEEVCSMSNKQNPSQVICGDASEITDKISQGSVDVAVVDPPYYSSIMYAELSDVFYVLQKQYLEDIYPDIFDTKLTNKDDEAVANPSNYDGFSGDKSKGEMADNDYEEKMVDIFNEIHDSLSEKGVMTVMFTHREMNAWDTLTSALIKSSFVITATLPVKTEMTDRIGMKGADSADSSILLTARKRPEDDTLTTSLWSDIEDEIYETAKDEAKDIINSEYHISKTDTAIAAYGPTLKEFVKSHPVVDKNGKHIRPRKALSEARQAVTSVLVEEYLNVNGVETIDSLTRWYILIWLIYENDTVISDEARQIGRAADIDIDNVDARSDTKIWGKSSGDVQLKDPSERVQDIVKLESKEADDPSSNKYPVDPTSKSFQSAIDAVHSAIHVYNREGSDRALQWLKERNMDTETEFHITIISLLETMPSGNDIRETLQKLVQGQTGEYLDIDLTTFSSTADPQTDISEWLSNKDE